jgi:hypothetical protein
MMTEHGYEAVLLAFDSNIDMYKCRVVINNNDSITAWFTDEEVKEMYTRKRKKEKEKKENHQRYVKKKKEADNK